MNRADEFRFGASLAGLGDLGSKILNAAKSPAGLSVMKPHLHNMVAGSAQMNSLSPSIDAAANKHSELYVAALALGAGLKVELEDPNASAGGTNPDLLLSDASDRWAIAVKALHSAKVPSVFANIGKGASQIERAGRPGIIFVNAKNIVDRDSLLGASPFASVELATEAVGRELDVIAHGLRSEIVEQDWEETFHGRRASRLIALMAQVTVSAQVGTGAMFVPVKVMKAIPAFAQSAGPIVPEDVDAAAWKVLLRLNQQLQRNV